MNFTYLKPKTTEQIFANLSDKDIENEFYRTYSWDVCQYCIEELLRRNAINSLEYLCRKWPGLIQPCLYKAKKLGYTTKRYLNIIREANKAYQI